jgi:hypothetical protein
MTEPRAFWERPILRAWRRSLDLLLYGDEPVSIALREGYGGA